MKTYLRRAEVRCVQDVLTLVLAGGKGTRLEPLTRDRAKPAVPFGGLYRIIDFTLSNCINSGLRRVLVLTQYKARSLDRHLAAGWSFLSRAVGEYVEALPPQQRIDFGQTAFPRRVRDSCRVVGLSITAR